MTLLFGSQELCLQTKLLAPPSCKVAEFLSKAPQPPPAHAIKNALQILKVAPSQSVFKLDKNNLTQTEMLYTGLRNNEDYRHHEQLLDACGMFHFTACCQMFPQSSQLLQNCIQKYKHVFYL